MQRIKCYYFISKPCDIKRDRYRYGKRGKHMTPIPCWEKTLKQNQQSLLSQKELNADQYNFIPICWQGVACSINVYTTMTSGLVDS